MRSRQQYIEEYATSHRNSANQLIHLICVPAIFFASIGFGYRIPIGAWIPGIFPAYSHWINGATLAAIPMLVFYGRLGWSSFITGFGWLAVSLAACAGIQYAGGPLLWIAVVTFVAAWIVQFVGHKLEGAKPSFFKDLFFLLIGPLFVQDKLYRLVRTGSLSA
jgi:uncharacterized membrane protein YGL010W